MKNNNNDLITRNDRIYYDPFFDEFFDFAMPRQERYMQKFMKTDVTEEEDSYLLSMDLPGFKKENISLDLDNGYLTISASKDNSSEDGKKYIRRERSYESCKRSFYVGEGITADDVSANMEDGVLKIKVMKKIEAPQKSKRIEIK